MTQPAVRVRSRRAALVSGVLGNAFESYDTAIYGYLAIVMGKLFFPNANPTIQILSSLAAFGITFLMRPLGAFIFGPMGDRVGRTRMMVIMIAGLALPTALIGVLPTYQAVGIAATICLVILRLIQGLAIGGETGVGSSYLTEFARPGRRGFTTSWYIWASVSGFLAGAVVVTVLTAIVGSDAITAGAWRIAFLIAAPLGLVALFMRLRISESPEFAIVEAAGDVSTAPRREVFGRPSSIVLCMGIGTLHAVAFYITFSFASTYIQTESHVDATAAFAATIVAGVLALIILPFGGLASDRWGRKAVLITGAIWILVGSYPAFILMSSQTIAGAFIGQAIMAIGVGIYLSTSTITMAELFPTRLRATGASFGYNLAAAAFGGTAPFIAALLIAVTGNVQIPALYVVFAAIVSIVCVALIGPSRLYKELPELTGSPQTVVKSAR